MPLFKTKYNLARTIILYLNIFFSLVLSGALLAGYIPPSQVTLFSVLALIYPVLVFINAAFVIFWIIFKSKWFLVSLIILLLGFSNLRNNFQFHFNQTPKTDSSQIKLLTYNVRTFDLANLMISLRGQKNLRFKKDSVYIKRMNDFKEFVAGQHPDIVCLQEFLSEGTPLYKPIEKLKTDMGFSNYYFECYYKPAKNRLTGLLILSKYPSVNSGKLKFEESETFGIFNDLIINNDTIRVFNIHLASIRLKPEDIDFVINAGQEDKKDVKEHASKIYTKLKEAFLLREKQIKFIKQELQNSPYHVILAGDFNDTPSSYVYRQITRMLQDSFREKGKGLGVTFAGKLPFLRIDYIMECSHFKTLQYRRYQTDYSDHYPICAILSSK